MWRAIGSVQSGDDKSVRSNQSRQDISFSQFHKHKSTHRSVQKDRSFCYDYLQKKREDYRNMTYDSRAKSQKSIRGEPNGKDDMFTSMRNILNKQDAPLSLLTSKNNNNEPQSQKPQDNAEKNQQLIKQTNSKVRTLKKEQTKLKTALQNEFMTFKNMFLQLEDKIHKSNQEKDKQEQLKTSAPANQIDTEFLKDILKQALGIEKYFGEMDRKKEEIMSRLSAH